MSSQSSSGSRGIKRARSVITKADGPASIKEEPPKKVKKKLKSSSTSSMSLVLTKTSAVTSSSRKPSTDSPMTEAPKHPPVTTLGSLPLHGEELLSGGYNDIPDSTKHTCDQIRDVLTKIKDIKEDKNGETELAAQKQSGLVMFSYLKKLNRLSHLYCKDSREQTHEQKLEVDDLHLQLQNLMYEAMHLRKEITNCLEFKSQHEDIDLVSEEEMYTNAPEAISKPEVSRSDEHLKMLSRLQWEMEERKSLAEQRSSLESDLQSLESDISTKDTHLTNLLPSLEELRKATLPLQDSLGVPLDKEKEERELALLLPRALYVVFTQAKAYSKVQDHSLCVSIEGDMSDAKAFLRNKDKEPSDDESGDSDGEGKEEGSRRKKRHKRSKGTREKKDLSKAYPLSVVFSFNMDNVGSFQVTLNYLPHFNAVCASVTFHTLTDSHITPLLERSTLLHCLTDGDTGRTSPNSVVSLNIRKHSGDIFSAAVRQYGFPYKWVQKVCGVNDQSDPTISSMPSMEVDEGSQEFNWLSDSQMELSAEHLENIIKSLKKRFKAQVNLASQIMALGSEDHQLMLGSEDSDQLFHGIPKSKITKWKTLSSSEVKTYSSTFASLFILNIQERTNKFYLFTLQLDQVRLLGLVCVCAAYPATPPCFTVTIEDDGTKESGNIHTKNIEAEVNMCFPRSIEGDKYGKFLLSRQIRRLQECFEIYIDHRQSPHRITKTLCKVRGKGRLLKLSDS